MSDVKLFDVPNLDDLSVPADDWDAAADVFKILAAYSLHKARAVRLRLEGKTLPAARIENDELCDLYRRLPEWARW